MYVVHLLGFHTIFRRANIWVEQCRGLIGDDQPLRRGGAITKPSAAEPAA